MPVRRTYDPALYVTVTHTLYRYFAIVGAVIEVGAVVLAVLWVAGLARSRTSPISARRWAHAARCGLFLLGFGALLASGLTARPGRTGRGKSTG